MATQAGFVLKVLTLSLGISVFIKYLAPSLNIAPTPTNAMLAVLLPTLVMAMVLLWRTFQQRQTD